MELCKPNLVRDIPFLLCALLLFSILAAAQGSQPFDPTAPVVAVTREEGSGTRSAFTECLGITRGGVDAMDTEAVTAGGSAVVLAAVRADGEAIGYLPVRLMGSAGVCVVAVDGVLPSAATLPGGEYPLCRPLTVALGKSPNRTAAELCSFILSAEGCEVISSQGYAPCGKGVEALSEVAERDSIRICCSATAAPLIKELVEVWSERHPNAEIELHRTDTSSALMMLFSGTCDIAVASRALTEAERQSCASFTFALDGIAVIVNESNPVRSLTKAQLRKVFMGEYACWREVLEDGNRQG